MVVHSNGRESVGGVGGVGRNYSAFQIDKLHINNQKSVVALTELCVANGHSPLLWSTEII
ncbi:MAG: hypothetical protein QNJ68_16680 [Microcoleaceae cyanobacterium MO_207.B10]|nr:hypothetical protein [Microcoleaceae cyanobacterium MO_207.B10]